MPVSIEFVAGTGIPDLPSALDIIARVGGGLTLLVDTMHLCRSERPQLTSQPSILR